MELQGSVQLFPAQEQAVFVLVWGAEIFQTDRKAILLVLVSARRGGFKSRWGQLAQALNTSAENTQPSSQKGHTALQIHFTGHSIKQIQFCYVCALARACVSVYEIFCQTRGKPNGKTDGPIASPPRTRAFRRRCH